MLQCQATDYAFPSLPFNSWEPARETLHLFCQIVGKIRLGYHPRLNHWWHASLYPSVRGLTTGKIPYCGREFEIEFDFIMHQLEVRTSEGEYRQFGIPRLSVAEFYHRTLDSLESLGLPVQIVPKPYRMANHHLPFPQDHQHHDYDPKAVHQYWRILSQVSDILEEFRGRFTGKSTPVHFFWHSFDLALTRFSGRPAPPREGANRVDAEAYSHEVISFGFWPGDPDFPEPAFYSYTYPTPAGLTQEPLQPPIAFWGKSHGSEMALMPYEAFRKLPDPHQALLNFLESAYQAGAKKAGWPLDMLAYGPLHRSLP